jgi:hypothetical protein
MQPGSDQPSQPIDIVVAEKQPPLTVTGRSHPVAGSQNGTTEKLTLDATVTTANGASFASSDLTWRWDVNGQTLTTPSPLVALRTGSWPVSVTVYDAATGTGGATTFDVTVGSVTPRKAKTRKPGAGKHDTGAPTGSTKGHKNSTGNGAHRKSRQQRSTTRRQNRHHHAHHQRSTSDHHHQSTTPPATTPPATTPPATPPVAPPATPPADTTPGFTPVNGGTKPPPKHRHHHTQHHHPAHHTTSGTRHRTSNPGGGAQHLVTGRLVGDPSTASASQSPLVHAATSEQSDVPLVHAAETSMSLPAWLYGALAVVALLAGGAVYERRGRRGRSLHR